MTLPLRVPLSTDEPVASLLRILALTESGVDCFSASSLPQVRRVYGGQVLAQSLLAAGAALEDLSRLPHSLHAYFLRGGDPALSFNLCVERLHDGRSFSSRRVTCTQNDREILSFTCSFQGSEDGLFFTEPAPEVPEPESLQSALEIFRMMDHPVGRFLGRTAAFDVRHVSQDLYTTADPSHSSTQHLWMRPRSPIDLLESSVLSPLDQHLHRALLAYIIDQVMFEPAMRATGQSWMTPGMSAASLDHAMWFHRDININEWHLFSGECLAVNNGRMLTQTRVFSRDGVLVAEATQQGMLRIPTDNYRPASQWGFGVSFQESKAQE